MLYFFNVVRSPCHALRDFFCPIGPCPDSPAYGIHLDLQRQLWDLEDNTKHFHQLLSTPNQCCDHKNNVKKDTKISENTTLTFFFRLFLFCCVFYLEDFQMALLIHTSNILHFWELEIWICLSTKALEDCWIHYPSCGHCTVEWISSTT